MIISRIDRGSDIYFNLHAEQTVTGTFLDEPGSGVFEEMLTLTTIERIISIGEGEDLKSKTLVLDFSNIKSCQSNIKKKIISLIEQSNLVVLTNILLSIVDDLEVGLFKNHNNIKDDYCFTAFYLSNESKAIEIVGIYELFQEEFLRRIKTHIEKGLDSTGKYILHDSSSVYLSSYINIKRFISRDKSFFIYSVYQLALKMKNHWTKEILNSEENEKPTLICQNLNSSFIASILSSLLKLDVLILDKIGPINKLYSTLDKKIEEGKSYIVISDLVCLGTEIKIAKSIIDFLGGRYIGNVSIIRVETLRPEDRSFDDIECVFFITNDNNIEIGYQITTALNL